MNTSLARQITGPFASKISGQFAPVLGGQFTRFLQNLNKSPRIIFSVLFILSVTISAFSQVKQIEDPALTHSNYIAIDAGMNYVSPNYTYRNAVINGVTYYLGNNLSGAYQPIASLEIGHVFKSGSKYPFIFRINSGVSVASYVSHIVGDSNNTKNFSETFLQVPLAISTHIPLQIYQTQAKYHALELKFGGYYGLNIKREMQTDVIPESGSTNDFSLPAQKFGKFSLFAEAGVSFTSLNGHSHEIGIRASHDMGPYIDFKNAPELPFLYNSVGVFYRWTFYCF